MIAAGPTLALLLGRCAPDVAPTTMAAIVQVESGGDPLAIGDNTARRSYHPRDLFSAEAQANRLLGLGHLLDVGLTQIDNVNFARFGVDTRTVFDPCTNLRLGARILSADYALAVRRYRDAQLSLRHAIGMYNTGRLTGGARYIQLVLRAAGVHDTREPASHDPRRRNVSGRHRSNRKHIVVAREPEQQSPERSPILAITQEPQR